MKRFSLISMSIYTNSQPNYIPVLWPPTSPQHRDKILLPQMRSPGGCVCFSTPNVSGHDPRD